jgi:hypothetical protein
MKGEEFLPLPIPPRMKEVITFNSAERSIHNIVPITDGGKVPRGHPGLDRTWVELVDGETNEQLTTQARLSYRVWLLSERRVRRTAPEPIAAGALCPVGP